MELKISIKVNVNFFFLERTVDFTIPPYDNKNVGSLFFVKFPFQNQFAGGFP